ncbi:MAG: hypothetical protein J0L72_00730 [Armatimonadetes bacterium]|nr:hypothetical protein [Armatimonadota bacterium]
MRTRWDRTKGRPEPIAALNRVIERENGEPLVALSEYAPSLHIHREQVIPYLRKSVAQMCERAAQSLPSGYRLGVIDAWRPFARQVRIYEWMTASAREVFPDLPYHMLKRRVNRWVAPIDQKAPPGHCTGAAVDVFLVNSQLETMDVWSPFSRFRAAPTYTLGLTEEAQFHRDLLVNCMLEQGFSNCRDEWWHYSYGDAGWAVRSGLDECFYGLAELPPEMYEREEALWIEAQKDRKNPFLD